MTFEETCRELGVSEAELEQLVAAGEIASIKEGDTLFFKADAVARYKESRGDDTILLADEEISLLDDDDLEEIDLLAMDDDEDSAPTTPVARPVGAVSEPDISLDAADELSLDDEGLPEIDLDLDSDLVTGGAEAETAAVSARDDSDETLLNIDGLLEEEAETTTPIVGDDLGDDTLLDTELDFGEETDTFDVDTVDDLTSDLTDEGTFLRGGGARVMQMKRKENNLWTTVVLALCAVALLLPLAVTTNTIYYSRIDYGRIEPEAAPGAAPRADSYAWVRDYNFFGAVIETVADAFKTK